MARPPIGKRAMTPAERQRRRRKKLRRHQSAEVQQQLRRKRRDEHAKKYMPMPPGITYWRTAEILTADGPREIRTPATKPLAACEQDLEDDEVMSLLRQLTRQASPAA
jgi:hypothetical protein